MVYPLLSFAYSNTPFPIPKNPSTAASEQAEFSIHITCDGIHLLPGTVCSLEVHTDFIEEIQYAGAEIQYDPTRFSFESAQAGSFFGEEALSLGKNLNNRTLGVSASSITGEKSGYGDLINVYFRVIEEAQPGVASFSLVYAEAANSQYDLIPVHSQSTVFEEIPPYIQTANINDPPSITYPMDLPPEVRITLHGFGLTEALFQPDQLCDVEIGFTRAAETPDSLHPAEWMSPDWHRLDFEAIHGSNVIFIGRIPGHLTTGKWRMAARVRLDDQPYLYIGQNSDSQNGTWNTISAPSVLLDITIPEVILSRWSFDQELLTPDFGTHANVSNIQEKKVQIVNARVSGYINGATGRAVNSNQWHEETDDEGNSIEKYWLITFSTEGYRAINTSFFMNGSSSGPRNFLFQYRTGSNMANWKDVEGGSIILESSWNRFHMVLPEDAYDNEHVQIRLLRIENTSINNSDIGTTGTNRLDELAIRGIPANSQEITVWPGDTRHTGFVSEEAVMNIGYYWNATGPSRIPRDISWAPQTVVSWTPESASFADTNGDGIIDYKDILAIGRNFGKQITSKPLLKRYVHQFVSTATLPKLEAGNHVEYAIYSKETIALLGLSTRLKLEGIDKSAFIIESFLPGSWADSWIAHDRLLSFGKNMTSDDNGYSDLPANTWSKTWIHKGNEESSRARIMAIIRIKATHDWHTMPQLHLKRAMYKDGEGKDQEANWFMAPLESVTSGRDEFPSAVPGQTLLYPNYPNPFNPVTTIPFSLTEPGQVQLIIYDSLGREVSRLIDHDMPAGNHSTTWSASGLSSGMYLYRLQTEHYSLVRSMLLIK